MRDSFKSHRHFIRGFATDTLFVSAAVEFSDKFHHCITQLLKHLLFYDRWSLHFPALVDSVPFCWLFSASTRKFSVALIPGFILVRRASANTAEPVQRVGALRLLVIGLSTKRTR